MPGKLGGAPVVAACSDGEQAGRLVGAARRNACSLAGAGWLGAQLRGGLRHPCSSAHIDVDLQPQWKSFYQTKWMESLDNPEVPVPGEACCCSCSNSAAEAAPFGRVSPLLLKVAPLRRPSSMWRAPTTCLPPSALLPQGPANAPAAAAGKRRPHPMFVPRNPLRLTSPTNRPHSGVHGDTDQCSRHRRHPGQQRDRALLVRCGPAGAACPVLPALVHWAGQLPPHLLVLALGWSGT